MKPLCKVKIEWSPNFAYAIGLITTDGNLSIDGRHINFTSKDSELVVLIRKCLCITNKIGKKSSERAKEKKYYVIQFGDVAFYKFLLGIGLTPHKSKTLGSIAIPKKFFFDFLRGHFDGDGSFYAYFDPRWRSSYMFYTSFVSASKEHILWLRRIISNMLGIRGHITHAQGKACYQLKYAKSESIMLLKMLYSSRKPTCLKRKHLKVLKALAIIGISL